MFIILCHLNIHLIAWNLVLTKSSTTSSMIIDFISILFLSIDLENYLAKWVNMFDSSMSYVPVIY